MNRSFNTTELNKAMKGNRRLTGPLFLNLCSRLKGFPLLLMSPSSPTLSFATLPTSRWSLRVLNGRRMLEQLPAGL
jgi:hypothetical protein